MIIKAIPTRYKGILFRSKLEAQWAKFFDKLNIEWIYEPEGIEFDDGTKYLPDFYLPELECFFEVKGIMSDFDRNKVEKLAHSGLCKQVVVGYGNGKIELYEDESSIQTDLHVWYYACDACCHDCKDNMDWCSMVHWEPYAAKLGHCPVCGKYFFFNQNTMWYCRHCGEYSNDQIITFKLDHFQELSQIDVRNKEC